MAFHPEKCTTLPDTDARKVLEYPYQLHGHTLETTDSANYLGVTINKDLGWNTHIDNICARANKTLGFFRRNLKIGSTSIKQTAFVRTIMEYASTVWDPHAQHAIDKFEAMPRRTARYVLRRYHNTSSVKDMLEELRGPSYKNAAI